MTGSTAARKSSRVHVVQGEHAVSNDPNVVLTTLLGSCVAACLYDYEARVGGMNHFLLPGPVNDVSNSMSYGVNAMELLINDLLRKGARRENIRAKLFGGGSMHARLTSADIGGQNAQFAQTFLSNENIPVIGGSTGGESARRVEFWPSSGRARQALLEREETIFREETKTKDAKANEDGDVELF